MFRLQVQGFDLDHCECMDSKKVPLWLAFKTLATNTEGTEVPRHFLVLFKTGDDLRQDILSLQILSIMNEVFYNK